MKTFQALLLSLSTVACGSTAPTTNIQKGTASVQAPKTNPTTQSGHLAVNGLDYYYEVHGTGEPLVLLHGGLGSIEMFGSVLPQLAANRTVIAVDLHGHGRTSIGTRAMSLEDMGDDIAAIVAHLGHKQVDVLGYSLGAGVAFRLAVQHPDLVRRLVLVSAGYSTDGFYPEMRPLQSQVSAAIAPMMKDTPMYQSYVKIAPHPEDFPKLLDLIGNFMKKTYDWSADVKKVKAHTLLVVGDSDMFRLDHVVEFYKLLGGAQRDAGWQREHQSKNRLAILPDKTHYDIFFGNELVDTVKPFLNGKSAAGSWADQVAKQ